MNTKATGYKHGGLDKYYTKPEIARDLVELLGTFLVEQNLLTAYDRIIEPSAGAGAFLEPMGSFRKPITAIDIHPDHFDVGEADLFEFSNTERALFIGNPPFGHAAHLAVKFFNHAGVNGAQIIAFVLPKRFRKRSAQNRLNRYFHLAFECEIPAQAFLLNGQAHDVPCIFQIWVKSDSKRSVQVKHSSIWIEFTHPDKAEHAMRRVGRRAGDILNGLHHNRSSTHFFNVAHPDVLEVLRENDEIKAISRCTAGVYSIGKSEIYEIVERDMAGKQSSLSA